MPGVPPDAVAQVKRGLRGLFSRKKRSQADSQPTSTTPQSQYQQQQTPTETQASPTETQPPPQTPTITTTAPSPSPGQTAEEEVAGSKKTAEDGFPPPPPGPQPGNNGIAPQPSTQIPPPAGMQEAKDIDLDPSSSVPPKPSSLPPHSNLESTNPTNPPTTTTPASPPRPTETPHTAPHLDAADKKAVDHDGMSATSGPLDDSAMMFGDGRGADADGIEFVERERGLEDDAPGGEVGTELQDG